MHAACQEAARWDKKLIVSVNVSAVQISALGFADMVRAALTDSGLSAARLEIEVTETALLDDTSAAREALRDLRTMGIRIALDDFGMGHASFAYLLTFPFDKIKIDRKFIADIAWRIESRTIVEAVAGMAHKLGIEVLAEGIEEVDQLVIAKLAGCELGQGLLLGEPRPADDHYRLRPSSPVGLQQPLPVAA
jgi:EAL domain-containing protein (putative c-di-GMP-specific phosphodiesterase class I)